MFEEKMHVFRPKARIMVLLGEQLIKNHTLALFELVKNAYDADATAVDITLLDVDKPDGIIEIQDNGVGMSYETVTNIWLEPAHDHKAKARSAGKRTDKGRLPVGEKGVGRFAVHRLGKVISMVTRAAGEEEVVVEIDWDAFLEKEYLDQSPVSVVRRAPEVFLKNNTGTRIFVSCLNQNWKRGDVRKLYRSVNSMTPPQLTVNKFEAIESTPNKFDVFDVNFLVEPQSSWLDGMFDPQLALSQSLFNFSFSLTDEGLTYSYKFTPFEGMKADYPSVISARDVKVENLKALDFFKNLPNDLSFQVETSKRSKFPSLSELGIGPIKGQIIAFDFDKEIYSRYQKDEFDGLSKYVKDQGGLRVYRDGLRVYSYGEAGDDWLHLDSRRVQSPGRKLGSGQMMGSLFLDLENSPQLVEKTNREGFVENQAYLELVHAVLSILVQFEMERFKDKRLLKDILKLPPGQNAIPSLGKKLSVEEQFYDLKRELATKEEYRPLIAAVEQVSRAYEETRNVLMSAAGAGMGLVTVFHEMERGVRGLHQAIKAGEKISLVESMSDELLALLQGAMYMINTKQMEVLNASRLVDYVLATQSRRFKRHGITFLNGFEKGALDFEVKGIRRMLTTTLVNLLDNAIYWADSGDDLAEEKFIWIGSTNDLEGPALVIADSGPGFLDSAEDLIQPFFTRKPSGMGIGLYYADMVMKTMGGRLAFPEFGAVERPSVVTGACLAMVFREGAS